ncbi:MAG: hypothetical protein AABX11_00435 [Nanoarchaeota archaeon]
MNEQNPSNACQYSNPAVENYRNNNVTMRKILMGVGIVSCAYSLLITGILYQATKNLDGRIKAIQAYVQEESTIHNPTERAIQAEAGSKLPQLISKKKT